MPKFRVDHVYATYFDDVPYGPYTPGEVVELDQALADRMNEESPGVMVAIPVKKSTKKR